MFGLGATELIIVLIIVVVLFGRGRISSIMGEFGKGLKSFKKGLNEEEEVTRKKNSKDEGSLNNTNHENHE